VRQNYEISEHDPQGMHGERQPHLHDHVPAADKSDASLVENGRQEEPGEEAHRQERQIFGNRLSEKLRVKQADATNHCAGAKSDPKGPEQGAAIPLQDVVPAEVGPNLGSTKPNHEIDEGGP
jgi:hypothetical protein